MNCTNEAEIYAFHPGGSNVVFGDGSTRFLKATITLGLLVKLTTRAGGETIDASEEY
jgi:prepilin-type processing-associated H-X9-DG protein